MLRTHFLPSLASVGLHVVGGGVTFYASVWAFGALALTWLALTVYLGRKLSRTRSIVGSYPFGVRIRVGFGRQHHWEHLVDRAHLDDLRTHARSGRRLLGAFLAFFVLTQAGRVLRQHWLARIEAIGDEAKTIGSTLPLDPRADPIADATRDIDTGVPQYFLYGEPLVDEDRVVERYRAQYGVTVRRIAGCEVDGQPLGYVSKYNDTIVARLGIPRPQ